MPPLSRAEALAEFGLGPGVVLTEAQLGWHYKRTALEHHPDKVCARGGDLAAATGKFQRLVAARDTLVAELRARARPSIPRPASAPTAPVAPAAPVGPQGGRGYSSGRHHGSSASRAGNDARCSFCATSAFMLTFDRAKAMLVDWEEYCGHPDKLQTCLMCKMAQRSVMTEEQALKKFPSLWSPGGSFSQLAREGRSFSVLVPGLSRIVYFWQPDLKRCAEGAGLQGGGSQACSASAATPEKRSECAATAAASACRGRGRPPGATALKTPEKRRGGDAGSLSGKKQKRADNVGDLLQGGPTAGPKTAHCMGTPLEPTAQAPCRKWRYRVIGDRKLGIRQGPSVSATPSASGHLRSGDVFFVCERVFRVEDGRLYLRLADGRGWTYDRSAKDPSKVVVEEISGEDR